MQITNTLGLPDPFVSAVTREYAHTDKRYSVTALLKGTREAILQRRHDDEIQQDVADMAWLIFGTAVHSVLENSQESETQLKENKIIVPMPNGYEVSGIFDLYDDATGTVTDYKTASVWKVIYNDWEDYRKQTLAYCWLLRQIGFDAKRGEVVALLKDHSKSKAEHESGYPMYPIYRIGWDFTAGDLEDMGGWIAAKLCEIEEAEKLPDDQLPLCTKDERWGKADTWAVKKAGNKRAAKVHESLDAAERHAAQLAEQQGVKYEVEYRPGEDTKCMKYCAARNFCDHYKAVTGDAE